MRASCCHSKAKLSCSDRLINCVLGCTLKLDRLGEEGLSPEQQASLLKGARKGMGGTTRSAKNSAITAHWRVDETLLPRPAEQGGDIPIVVHIPKGGQPRLPALIYAHGGGCVIGDEHDSLAATILPGVAKELKAGKSEDSFCWVSIGYRLAPEHQFPAPVDDVVYLYEAMMEPGRAAAWGFAPGKVGLMGVSAGAWLCSHAAVRLAKAGSPPALCAAVCPMIDPIMDKQSYADYGDLPSCPVPFMNYCWRALLEEEPGKPLRESLMREASLLHLEWSACRGMRFLNLTASCECFVDDGIELSKVVQAAGVEVTPVVAGGSHVICLMLDPPSLWKLQAWAAAALRA